MFLLIGTTADPCLGMVEAELRARGRETMVLGPEQLPTKRILWELGGSALATDYYSFAGKQLQGVLLRETWLGTYPAWLEAEDASYVGMESHAAFASFLSSLGVPVINRPQFRFRLTPLHTALDLGPVLACCGFRSQHTLVTSDLGAARQFLLDGGGYVLLGGLLDTAALVALTPDNSEAVLTAALPRGPVRLLKRLAATALQVFVVGQEVFGERALAPWHPADDPAQREPCVFVPFVVGSSLAQRYASPGAGARFCRALSGRGLPRAPYLLWRRGTARLLRIARGAAPADHVRRGGRPRSRH